MVGSHTYLDPTGIWYLVSQVRSKGQPHRTSSAYINANMEESNRYVKHGAVGAPYLPPHLRGRAQKMQEKPSDSPCVLPHLRGLGPSKQSLDPTRKAWATKSDTIVTGQKRATGFLDLAGEVRNKIYRYALTAKHNKPQKCVWSGKLPHEGQTYSFATGLLRINRQVYHEASSIFYVENGLVFVRECQTHGFHCNALESILGRNVPAIAMTRKASECTRMAMIYQFGSRDIMPTGYLEIQIVIAAKDFELFALIALEMSLSLVLPLAVMYSVQATEGPCSPSKATRQELLIGLSIPRGLKTALTNKLSLQQLSQGPRFTEYLKIDCETLPGRVEAKVGDGSYPSALFYFQKLEEFWVRELNHSKLRRWGRCALPVIKWKSRYAEALRKAGHDTVAHEVVKSAISMWQGRDVPGITQVLQSEICCLRARLDEIPGSLSKMRHALFWFGEALRYDPSNAALGDDIERVEKEIFVLDSSNW